MVILVPTTEAIEVHQSGLFPVIGMFPSVFNSLQIPVTIISLIPLCSVRYCSGYNLAPAWYKAWK